MSIRITDLNIFNKNTKDFLERIFVKENERESFNSMDNLFDTNKNTELIGINAENPVANISIAYDYDSRTFKYEVREKYNEEDIKNYKDNLQEAVTFIKELSYQLDNQLSISPSYILEDFIHALKNTDSFQNKKIDLGNDIVELDLTNPNRFTINLNDPVISTRNLFENNYHEIAKTISLNDLEVMQENIINESKIDIISNAIFIANVNSSLAFNTPSQTEEEIIEAEIIEEMEEEYSGMKI